MKTLNTYNTNFTTLDATVETANANKQVGIKSCINMIEAQIVELKAQYDLNSRKARKLVKDVVMMSIEGEKNKHVLRAYSVAFTIINRELTINTDLITVSQCENLANHGEVKAINELASNGSSETYQEDVCEYLKSLKTREVSVKTFEKKARK